MYLRFKRHKTTVFLSCEATEDLELVKQRLCDAIDEAMSNIQLRTRQNELLDEEKTLQEQGLHEDDLICFVFKIQDSVDDWEDVDIVSTNLQNSNHQQQK